MNHSARSNEKRKRLTAMLLAMLLVMFLSVSSALAMEAVPPQSAAGLSPTTGLPTDKPYQPLLVILNNAAQARPLVNLSEADIVYETIIWGLGHTRYTAIYNDHHPEKVGSLRSSRYYHEILREEWDCPFVAIGISSESPNNNGEPAGAKIPVNFSFNGTRSTSRPYVWRDQSLGAPHNVFANPALIVKDRWPDDPDNAGQPYAPRAPLFQFSDMPTKGTEIANAIEIHFEGINQIAPNFLASYAYNPQTRAYERSDYGFPQIDRESGARIVANNVIIQFCAMTYYKNELSRPVINLLGIGRMDAFIDGTRVQGYWKRDTIDQQTQFYTKGGVLQLQPGKTFIQIIPMSYSYDYDPASGLFRYAPDILENSEEFWTTLPNP